ncbi:MAG: HAMP domain-containing histidine kinase [Deltaproteobacteria bacterium]|nr:HAMP domain-containing histidine kinase [Deltaproteobacteria bacterium]
MKLKTESAENDQTESAKTLEGRFDSIKAIESARLALLSRRRFSLRLQIYLGFLLIFIFVLCIAAMLIITMYQVEDRLRFLEIVNDYALEIQQARRFEKNFFLYGTNLDDALENVYKANEILDSNSDEVIKILGKDTEDTVRTNMERYKGLLEHLAGLERDHASGREYEHEKKKIEFELRRHGHEMVSSAHELMNRERSYVSKAILRSRHIHLYSLIFLVIFLASYAYFLGSSIMDHIKRFAEYAQRIASGNFTPVMPTRRFRDEFTDLALAINQMILELENRGAVLVQSHKMRAVGTLTAGVAHELNNPLNNITITAHMLLEDFETLSDEERKDMINDVVNEAGRSKKIISNLLDFARESSSQLEPLNLDHLLVETISLASSQIKLSGIKIQFQATENLPRIHGDSQQLEQVFLNLILNAIDASQKGAKIQVVVLPADEPNYLAVKVIDFGTGIPEHIMPSVFDPFFTTKGKGKGTGLGLSVSQGIVAKHGGRIRVSSREGAGTTFTVTLPVTTIPSVVSTGKDISSHI